MVILVGAYLVLDQRGTRSNVDERIEQKSSQLGALKRELQTKQQGIDAVLFQINQIEEQREAGDLALQQITEINIDWYGTLAGLFDGHTFGASLRSVTAEPGGRVILVGETTEEESMSSLPIALSTISAGLEFQSIRWDQSIDPPSFTATFQVRR